MTAAQAAVSTVVRFRKRYEQAHLTAKERTRVREAIYRLPGHFRGELSTLKVEQLKDRRLRGLWRLKEPPFRVFFVPAEGEILVVLLDRRDEHTYDNLDRLDRLALVRRGDGVQVVEVAEAPPTQPSRKRDPVRAAKPPDCQNPLTTFTTSRLQALGLDDETIGIVRTMAESIDIAEALAERGVPADTVELVSDARRDPARYLAIFDDGRTPTVEDARIEEAELAERLTAADSSDSVAALNEDEFERVLRGSIEDWMFYLHPSQARIVRHAATGPSRVRGGPGTGKTVAALHRARHLVQTEQADRVLLTTFVSVLPPVWDGLLAAFAPDVADQITTRTVDSLARGLANWNGEILSDESRRRMLLENALRHTPGLKEAIGGPDNLAREIDFVLAGRGVRDLETYLSVERRGRSLALSAPQRALVWAGYQRYLKELADENVVDWPHLRLRALERAEAGEGPRFDAVIVDEAQDLTEIHVRLLAALDTSPDHSGLMLVGDGQQAIYPGGFSLRSVGLDVRGRSFLLRTNWRNTQRIAVAAEAAIGDLPFGDLEDGEETRRADDAPLPRRLGDAPELHILSPTQEAEVVALVVEEALERVEPADVAVLSRTNTVWQRVERALKASAVPTVRLKGYRGETVDAVRVGTFAMSKGLEFKIAFLVGMTESEWQGNPFWLSDESDRQEWRATQQRTLFVAMTRARDRLVIVAGPQLPTSLERARPNFDETSWA